MPLTIAITGGTGFVGRHTLMEAVRQGLQVRALTRRKRDPSDGITWIAGALEDRDSLARLCAGADAVIHLAGVTNAPDAAGFEAGNVLGTACMRRAAGGLPFVHVSSLSAREPQLSAYGSSKRRAEDRAREGPGRIAMVRPPAIYGPGDTELLALFKAVRLGIVPLPSNARASMLYAPDLAEALIALARDLIADGLSDGGNFEIDDGHGGYTQAQIARTIATALGRRATIVPIAAAGLRLGAAIDTAVSRLRGRAPKLSFDRASYLAHPDWTVNMTPLLSLGLWKPRTALPEGTAETARWYRAAGWL